MGRWQRAASIIAANRLCLHCEQRSGITGASSIRYLASGGVYDAARAFIVRTENEDWWWVGGRGPSLDGSTYAR